MMKRGALALALLLPVAAAAQVMNPGMSRNGANATAPALAAIAAVATGCGDVNKVVTGIGTCETPAAAGAMLTNASNASLPAALENLGLLDGTASYYTLGSSLYPQYAAATTTTANTTNGNANITVASASGIAVGDVISATSPSFIGTAPVWVTTIVGTTLTLSSNATATRTGASVTFGVDRFAAGKTAFSDVFGAKYGYFGAAAVGHSTWPAKYWLGADYAVDHSVYSVSPNGAPAGLFAARSSDTSDPLAAVIAHGTLLVADNTLVSQSSWAQYIEGDTIAGSLGTQHFNTESTLVNGWTASAAADPYTDNPVGSTFNLRLASGFGGRTSNDVTAALHILTATGKFTSGIVFGNDALNISGGPASALALGPSQSIDWFSAAGNKAWRLYSTATSGNNTLILDQGFAALSTSLSLADSKFICFVGDTACSAGNFAIFGASSQTVINAPAGGFVDLRINNVSKLLVDSSGNITASGSLITPKLAGYAVANLPAGTIGMLAYVTDQITACPVPGVAPTAGGAFKCPVFYNGAAWVGM